MPLLLDRLLAVALADGGGGGSLPPHLALDTPRRACVAIVLRVPAAAGATAAPQFEDLAALRRWLEAQPAPDRPDAEVGGWVDGWIETRPTERKGEGSHP